jgi:hypothetical protein
MAKGQGRRFDALDRPPPPPPSFFTGIVPEEVRSENEPVAAQGTSQVKGNFF